MARTKANPSTLNGLAHARRQARAALAGVGGTDPAQGFAYLPRDTRPMGKLSVAARAYFDSIMKGVPLNHFYAIDLPILEQYCVFLARIDKDRDEFERTPRTMLSSNKTQAIHPIVKLYIELEDRVNRMRYQLRLDSSQRPKTQAQRDAERSGALVATNAPSEETPAAAADAPAKGSGRRSGLLFGRALLPAHGEKLEDR